MSEQSPFESQVHFEDVIVGQVVDSAEATLSEADIIGFGHAYDPQPFHVDPEAAARSLLGGLAASGWHSCALAMRLFYDSFVRRVASRGAPGVDEVRWLAPLRPGVAIRARTEVIGVRASASLPDLGFVSVRLTLSQGGIECFEQRFAFLIARRQRAADDAPKPSRAPRVEPAPPELVTPEIGLGASHIDAVQIGATTDLGEATFERDDIIGFARLYDPQPFHLGDDADSPYGGLIASGWQTTALWMRRYWESRLKAREAFIAGGADASALLAFDTAIGPSPGFEKLEWRRAVRPGDRLRFTTAARSARPLQSRPGWGLLTAENGARNQHGEIVLRFIGKVLMRTG